MTELRIIKVAWMTNGNVGNETPRLRGNEMLTNDPKRWKEYVMKFKDGPPEGTGSKNFIKLSPGESISGVFRGDPHDFKQHWLGDHSEVCLGAKCEECAKGNKASFRFRINFIIKEGQNQYVPKIFEQGRMVYNALKSLHQGGYDLEKNVMKITRVGGAKETVYNILPVPNGAVSTEFEKTLATLKLHDLVNLENEKVEEHEDMGDIPF